MKQKWKGRIKAVEFSSEVNWIAINERLRKLEKKASEEPAYFDLMNRVNLLANQLGDLEREVEKLQDGNNPETLADKLLKEMHGMSMGPISVGDLAKPTEPSVHWTVTTGSSPIPKHYRYALKEAEEAPQQDAGPEDQQLYGEELWKLRCVCLSDGFEPYCYRMDMANPDPMKPLETSVLKTGWAMGVPVPNSISYFKLKSLAAKVFGMDKDSCNGVWRCQNLEWVYSNSMGTEYGFQDKLHKDRFVYIDCYSDGEMSFRAYHFPGNKMCPLKQE